MSAKEEKKKRTPAWCDRSCGWGRTSRRNRTTPSPLTASDHKPVRATFRVTARELMPERLQATLQEARRRMDAAEMASQPRSTLENAQADLGEVRFAEPKSTTFRLVNTGDVAATWRFVSAVPGAVEPAPPWISLAPARGRLLPGEEVEITATACVRGGGAGGPAALAGATVAGTGAAGATGATGLASFSASGSATDATAASAASAHTMMAGNTASGSTSATGSAGPGSACDSPRFAGDVDSRPTNVSASASVSASGVLGGVHR